MSNYQVIVIYLLSCTLFQRDKDLLTFVVLMYLVIGGHVREHHGDLGHVEVEQRVDGGPGCSPDVHALGVVSPRDNLGQCRSSVTPPSCHGARLHYVSQLTHVAQGSQLDTGVRSLSGVHQEPHQHAKLELRGERVSARWYSAHKYIQTKTWRCCLPDHVEDKVYFLLRGVEQVSAQLVEQPGDQDVQPVVQVILVRHDEVGDGVQEQAEHLQPRTTVISTYVMLCRLAKHRDFVGARGKSKCHGRRPRNTKHQLN